MTILRINVSATSKKNDFPNYTINILGNFKTKKKKIILQKLFIQKIMGYQLSCLNIKNINCVKCENTLLFEKKILVK